MNLTGGVVCTLTLSKLMKVHDCVIGTFAALMDTLAALGFFFAEQDWQLYSGSFVALIRQRALTGRP